jgi:hypothetical protein
VITPRKTQFLISLMFVISAVSSTMQWKTLRVVIVRVIVVRGVVGCCRFECGLSLDATHLAICESQCSFALHLWTSVSAKLDAKK